MIPNHDDPDPLAPEQEILSAVEHNEFELYYQPLVDLRDHSVYGVEALIRWNHPRRGLLLPAEFIQPAEECGAIVPLGLWVLRRACTDFQALRAAHPDLLLSINISTRQVDEPDFISTLFDILRDTAMPHRQLQLEITESLFRDPLRAGALLHAIRALGVRIAFDDFGTGYSSVNYLERCPVDVLKVDQYFVRDMGNGKVSNQIVKRAVDLGRAVGMAVTAEGVESHEQADTLKAYGCNLAQGYLYSRPVPLHAITQILKHRSLEAFGGRRKDPQAAVRASKPATRKAVH
jgi:EAL domain-containing protein (putative c-di-GMP-specific phosphodiesterase class I)